MPASLSLFIIGVSLLLPMAASATLDLSTAKVGKTELRQTGYLLPIHERVYLDSFPVPKGIRNCFQDLELPKKTRWADYNLAEIYWVPETSSYLLTLKTPELKILQLELPSGDYLQECWETPADPTSKVPRIPQTFSKFERVVSLERMGNRERKTAFLKKMMDDSIDERALNSFSDLSLSIDPWGQIRILFRNASLGRLDSIPVGSPSHYQSLCGTEFADLKLSAIDLAAYRELDVFLSSIRAYRENCVAALTPPRKPK